MAEAVRAAAEPGDGFAQLVDDLDVVQPGGFALVAHRRAGGEAIAGQCRADEIDAAAGGHRRQSLAVAGVGEGGIRQAEQLAAVAGLVAIEHLRADGHADLCVPGVDGINMHPHRLSAGILLKHLFGAALSQRARRIGVHRSAPGKVAGEA